MFLGKHYLPPKYCRIKSIKIEIRFVIYLTDTATTITKVF